ncbi:MAG TPA: xanthine dehydrogenase family protein subunit M [Rhizomicrobium sp.]|jgi:carbon-monoxide dehydrogenase medium subunit
MIPYAFNYHRPKSLSEARTMFRALTDAKYLAGGQTLIPAMKLRLAAPKDLIDLRHIDGLSFIRAGETLAIGAGTTHAEVAESDEVKAKIPALAALAGSIGDPAVRHLGTIGGSLANNDPAADYPAAALALHAKIRTTARTIDADNFFTGMFATVLEADEIVTGIEFPVPERAGYAKFRNPASRYAIAAAFVSYNGSEVRVAVTGAGPCVFRVAEMEKALAKTFAPEAIADVKVPDDRLNSDLHASAEYRAHLITVMAKRAVAAANA